MKKLRFYDYMRSAHVKRWHVVSTIHNQSLAEHQFLVMLIALELFENMVGQDVDAYVHLQLAMMAAFHDMPETRTGDIPTPAKAEIRGMLSKTDGPDVFKGIEHRLMPEVPYTMEPWPNEESDDLLPKIVKMADMIADAWWITENAMGIHGNMVAKGNVQAMMKYASQLDDIEASKRLTAKLEGRELPVDEERYWVKNVNAILQELGMPYISVSLRETPP